MLRHPAVAEVCVLGCEDEERLVKQLGFVVVNSGHREGPDLATRWKEPVERHLARYKYQRWFEWRQSLPKNDRGKVARKELRAELAPPSRAL